MLMLTRKSCDAGNLKLQNQWLLDVMNDQRVLAHVTMLFLHLNTFVCMCFRSKSSSNSIQDLEMNVEGVHLSALQTPLTPFAEVFLSTDCNAIQCPIHRYGEHTVTLVENKRLYR